MSRCNAQHPKLPEIRCQKEANHWGDHCHGCTGAEVYLWRKYLTADDYREPEPTESGLSSEERIREND